MAAKEALGAGSSTRVPASRGNGSRQEVLVVHLHSDRVVSDEST